MFDTFMTSILLYSDYLRIDFELKPKTSDLTCILDTSDVAVVLSYRWRWRGRSRRAHRLRLSDLVSSTPYCWGNTFLSVGTGEPASWSTSQPDTGYECIITLLLYWLSFIYFFQIVLYWTCSFVRRVGCVVCVVTLMGMSTMTWWAATTSWRWIPPILGTPGKSFPAVPM